MINTVLRLVSSGTIDLLSDIPISLNFSIADIREPAKRSSSFSKTINIPGSKNNNNLFKHIYQIEGISNFNPKVIAPVVLEQDGIPVMTGIMQLLNIITQEDKITYQVTIIGDTGGLFQAIEGKELTDIDLSSLDHTLNLANIQNSWTATTGEGYVYNLMDRGYNNGTQWDIETFVPSIYVKEYIDRMFSDAGYTYTSTFFDSTFFKTLIIPYTGGKAKVSDAIMLNRSFELSNSANIAIPAVPNTFIPIDWDTEDSDPGNNVLNGYYTVPTDGTYNFTYAGDISYIGNIYIAVVHEIFISAGNYNTTYLAVEALPGINSGITTYSGKTPDVSLSKFDRVFFAVSARATSSSLNLKADSIFTGKSINTGLSNGDTVSINNTIPVKIKQKDFFMSLVKMFNLYLSPNPSNSKDLLIETRNDYYNTDVVDWTDRWDTSNPMIIKPLGGLAARRYIYAYKPDSDYYNNLYQTRYNDETYGQRVFYTDNEFTTKDIKTDIIFSNTPMIGNRVLVRSSGTDDLFIYPSVVDSQSILNPSANNPSSNIRIMMYNGIAAAPYWSIVVDGVENPAPSFLGIYQYPFSGHINSLLFPTIDLSFGAPKVIFWSGQQVYTDANLYNVYHKQFIEEITDKDSKSVTVKMLLRPTDISALSFRVKYLVDGNLYRLNSIKDYNPNKPSLSTVEFILIKEAVTFSASTTTSSGGVDVILGD